VYPSAGKKIFTITVKHQKRCTESIGAETRTLDPDFQAGPFPKQPPGNHLRYSVYRDHATIFSQEDNTANIHNPNVQVGRIQNFKTGYSAHLPGVMNRVQGSEGDKRVRGSLLAVSYWHLTAYSLNS